MVVLGQYPLCLLCFGVFSGRRSNPEGENMYFWRFLGLKRGLLASCSLPPRPRCAVPAAAEVPTAVCGNCPAAAVSPVAVACGRSRPAATRCGPRDAAYWPATRRRPRSRSSRYPRPSTTGPRTRAGGLPPGGLSPGGLSPGGPAPAPAPGAAAEPIAVPAELVAAAEPAVAAVAAAALAAWAVVLMANLLAFRGKRAEKNRFRCGAVYVGLCGRLVGWCR